MVARDRGAVLPRVAARLARYGASEAAVGLDGRDPCGVRAVARVVRSSWDRCRPPLLPALRALSRAGRRELSRLLPIPERVLHFERQRGRIAPAGGSRSVDLRPARER